MKNDLPSNACEVAAFLNRRPVTNCHVIQFPAGTWGFVGAVHAQLAYVDAKTGAPATEEQRNNAASFGPRVSGVKTASWATREEALAAADAIGAEVANR